MPFSSGTTSPASSLSGDLEPEGLSLAFGRFVFRYRDFLALAAIFVILLTTRPRPFLGHVVWDRWLDAAGLFVALCGQSLRVFVIGLAYIKRGGRNKTITADRLVCEGVFAHCRNPMYVGNFLMLTGLTMVWNSPWAYLTIPPILAYALLSIVRAEETFLAKRFGAEFHEYCQRVNRFVPDFRGLRRTLEGFTFDWKRVVRKEYGTLFAFATTVLLLISVEHLRWEGFIGASETLAWTGGLWILTFALWATARILKKSGRLRSPD